MRVVYYTHTAFFEPALSLARELSRQAEVHLLLEMTPSSWRTAAFDAPARELPAGLVPADEFLRRDFPVQVRDYWSGTASFSLVAHDQPRSLHPRSFRISRDVIRFVEDLAPTIFHVDDVDVTPRLALALPLLRRAPLVLSVHDPEPHSGERNWRKSLARSIANRKASRFVFHNASSAPGFRQRYGIAPERSRVVKLGPYDILRAWDEPLRARQSPTILFFGRISSYKGLSTLYEALPAVQERIAGVRCVVAGKPVSGYSPPRPPPGAPIETIERYVGAGELAGLVRGADVVVCPYLNATQSGVILTAYAFGVPVVASDVGGIREYLPHEETGLLVPPGDAVALSAAIVRVLSDSELRNSLRAGIETASRRNLSWSGAAAELMDLYTRVLQDGAQEGM